MLLPVSFYGGYFGAGVGMLLLGVFSVATGGDYRSANVAKNLVTSLNTFVAAFYFVAQGAVSWPQTLALMAGTIGGGLLGARSRASCRATSCARAGRRGRRAAHRRFRLALLVLELPRLPARASRPRARHRAAGSLSGSTTVK